MQKSFEVKDIKGGITDEYIESDPRFVSDAENLCLDPSGDIVQRQGSHFLDGSVAKDGSFVLSNTPVTHAKEFQFTNPVENYLANIHNSGNSLSIKQFKTGIGLTSFDFTMPFFTTHETFNSSVWQAQPFFCNSSIATGQGNYPTKVTVDKFSQMSVISAGLPQPLSWDYSVNIPSEYPPTLTYNNVIYPANNDGSPGGVNPIRVSSIPTGVVNEFRLAVCLVRTYAINNVTYTDISKPFFVGYLQHTDFKAIGQATNEYKLSFTIEQSLRIFDGATQWQVNWENYSDITMQAFRTVNNGNIFYDIGKIGSDIGSSVYVPSTSFTPIGYTNNYFRWQFTSNFSDAQLQQNPVMYTTGGVQENDLPGRCKFNALVNDNYMYWVEAENPYRVRQSASRDPDSVPAGNFIDFPEQITGVASAADKLIVTTLNQTYRVDGFFDDFGNGSVSAEKISSETGCISHNSMVQVADGLYFCGIDGFYYTNGQTVQKISTHLSKTYYRLTQVVSEVSNQTLGSIKTSYGKKYVVSENQEITGVYDKINNRVLWTFLGGSEVLVLEKGYGINATMVFMGPWKLPTSRASDVSGNESIYARALAVFKNKIVRTDNLGNIFQLEDGVASDPRPFSLSANPAANWLAADRYPILYRLRTQANYLGSQMVTKYVTRISAIFKRATDTFADNKFFDRNLDVQITSINDKGRVVQDLKPIHYATSKDAVYLQSKMQASGSYSNLIKNYGSSDTAARTTFDKDNDIIKVTRRFMAKGLRCIAKAVEFKPALKLVAKSDDYELATYNGGAASLATFIWSQFTYTGQVITVKTGVIQSVDHSAEGYYLTLEFDNYKALYPVASVSGGGDTIVLSTPYLNYTGVAAPNGSYKWKLYAFPKNQFFGLCSYALSFTPFLPAGDFYRADGNAPASGQGEP